MLARSPDEPPPPSAVAELAQGPRRTEYTEEAVAALRWKGCLEAASPEFVLGLLKKIPEKCLAGMVAEFRRRDTSHRPIAPKREKFLTCRDAPLSQKL